MLKRVMAALGTLVLGAAQAYAGGFMQPNLSASGAGVANAFTATASDASAAAYNPAGAAWQEGLQLSLGMNIDYRTSSATAGGVKTSNNGNEPNSYFLYGSWMPLGSNLGVTFGLAPLYYLENDWPNAGNISMNVDHGAVDAVYAFNSNAAVSVGGDWYRGTLSMARGAASFAGKDTAGFGGHASLMWKFYPTWSLGVMARSGSNLKLTGGNQSMKLKLPDNVTVGLAHDFADVWRLEADAMWTRWSKLKNLNINSTAGGVVQANPLNLRDTVTGMLGLTWTWRENSQFRLGYAYEQGANKAAGFDPIMADQDGHRISLGAGGDAFGLHLDLAASYVFYPKKTATGTYAASYRDRRFGIYFSGTKTF